MIVIDDALPEEEFKLLEDIVFDDGKFPWYYVQSSAFSDPRDDYNSNGSWFHNVYRNGNYSSVYDVFIRAINSYILPKVDNCTTVDRIRIGKHTHVKENYVNGAHVDLAAPHKVAILYMNDSDGPTILYKNRFKDTQIIEKEDLEVMEKIDPKRNRLLIFDGLNFHSSSYPKDTKRRIVVNINFT
jgi:hypothetical protein